MDTRQKILASVESLLQSHHPKELEKLKSYQPIEYPPLVFVAIDNDLLPKAELIKHYVLKQGYLPIIGESALGTYLITNYHQYNKSLILRDCLPFIKICTHFWIFVDDQNKTLLESIMQLPEGVLFELAHWFSLSKTPVSLIHISQLNSPAIYQIDYTFFQTLQKKLISRELEISLITQQQQQKPLVYIAIADKHAKHADWLRMDAYRHEQVPACPYNLFSTSALVMSYKHVSEKRLLARCALAKKCEMIIVYGPRRSENFTLHHLDVDLLLELYLVQAVSSEIPIYYKSFYEAAIPKYRLSNWAVTRKENNENAIEQKGCGYSQPSKTGLYAQKSPIQDSTGEYCRIKSKL